MTLSLTEDGFWNYLNRFLLSFFLFLLTKALKLNIHHLLINLYFFFSESSYDNHLQVLQKIYSYPTTSRTSRTFDLRVLWHIFEKIATNLKMKSQELITSKTFKIILFRVLWIFKILKFLKNAPEYIDPVGHFVLHEIFCSTNFYKLHVGEIPKTDSASSHLFAM